jgi:hypothetical protein
VSTRLRKALVVAVAASCALVMVEAALRGGRTPERLEGLYVPDERLGYALAPGFCGRDADPHGDFDVVVCVDPDGHRRTEVPEGASGAPIWVLGGGFAFGTGVADGETTPSRLAQVLGRPVVNGGVEGYDLASVRTQLDGWLDAGPEPAAVVFFIDVARDLPAVGEPAAPASWTAAGGRRVPRLAQDAGFALRLDRALRSVWRTWEALVPDPATPAQEDDARLRWGLLGDDADDRRQRLARDLRAIVTRVLETRAPILVAAVVVPTRYQVDAAYRARLCEEDESLCAEPEDVERSLALVRRQARRLSLPFVDMGEALRSAEAQGGARLYDDHDPHWAPRAHSLAADAIAHLIRFVEGVQERNRAAGRRLPTRQPSRRPTRRS